MRSRALPSLPCRAPLAPAVWLAANTTSFLSFSQILSSSAENLSLLAVTSLSLKQATREHGVSSGSRNLCSLVRSFVSFSLPLQPCRLVFVVVVVTESFSGTRSLSRLFSTTVELVELVSQSVSSITSKLPSSPPSKAFYSQPVHFLTDETSTSLAFLVFIIIIIIISIRLPECHRPPPLSQREANSLLIALSFPFSFSLFFSFFSFLNISFSFRFDIYPFVIGCLLHRLQRLDNTQRLTVSL